MNHKIWLIGGTSESAAIAKRISQTIAPNLAIVITVATDAARSLYPPEIPIQVGCLDATQMASWCEQQQIQAIIDASHPYAVEVSQNAVTIAKTLHIPYLRYERSTLPLNSGQSLVLDSLDTLLEGNYLQGKRVLLTIGCQALPLFKSYQQQGTLFARILPKPESLRIALDSGFTSDRLICLRPPISTELEAAIWRKWEISLVVTKASGKAGGEDIKHQVARELNIPLITIARPTVIYPQQTSCLEEVVDFSYSV